MQMLAGKRVINLPVPMLHRLLFILVTHLILTGEEIPPPSDPACSALVPNPCALLKTASGASVDKLIGGPVYMADMTFSLQSPIEFQRAQLMHTASDCSVVPTIPRW